jgi:hypothetical protein
MTSIKTAFALVLLTAAGFAGVTYAEGDYYEGTQENVAGPQPRPPFSRDYTGSVSHSVRMNSRVLDGKAINSGDYYEGAQRPN